MAPKTRNPITALVRNTSGVADLFSIVREMSFEELRQEALTPPRLLLLGADTAALALFRDALGGDAGASFIDTARFDQAPQNINDYDGLVLVNATPADRAQPAIKRLLTNAETAARVLTVQLPPSLGEQQSAIAAPSQEAIADLRRRLTTRLSHRQLALGRYLPAFRHDATSAVISSTARANAEFALLSNIPAIIPIVGNIVAAGADFLVLTKNQLMLIYKLAAIQGRDINQPWRLYTEMIPVVGAGLVWRTVARELAALLPFAAGTLPKVIVAYAGTTVVGQAANFYYVQGRRASGKQMRAFYRRAAELARTLPLSRRNDNRDVIEGHFTERPLPPSSAPPPSTPTTSTEQPRRPEGADHAGTTRS